MDVVEKGSSNDKLEWKLSGRASIVIDNDGKDSAPSLDLPKLRSLVAI